MQSSHRRRRGGSDSVGVEIMTLDIDLHNDPFSDIDNKGHLEKVRHPYLQLVYLDPHQSVEKCKTLTLIIICVARISIVGISGGFIIGKHIVCFGHRLWKIIVT